MIPDFGDDSTEGWQGVLESSPAKRKEGTRMHPLFEVHFVVSSNPGAPGESATDQFTYPVAKLLKNSSAVMVM
jgi:hypothetical protein